MISTIKGNKVIMEFELGDINNDIINFLSSLEIGKKSKASDNEISKLAQEIKQNWWNANKERLLGENSD